MNKLLAITISLLFLINSSVKANEDSNRAVRCFFQNLGGCTNVDGSCRRFCVDKGCNLAQEDFCTRQGFPPDRRQLSSANEEESEASTKTTTNNNLDNHGIDFNMTNLEIPPQCFSQSYDLHLVVAEGHLFLSALPSYSTEDSTCPSLVASTVYENGRAMKQLASIGPELVAQVQEKALFLESLELNTIKHAFSRAIVTTEDNDDSWDMMENNCSVFVMSMLQEVGINFDSDVIRMFVRLELMQSEIIMTRMEEAMAGQGSNRLLRGGVRLLRKLMGDQEMVDHVVDHNIKHFQTYTTNGQH